MQQHLTKLEKDIAKTLEKIMSREKYINSQLESLVSEFRQQQDSLAATQDKYVCSVCVCVCACVNVCVSPPSFLPPSGLTPGMCPFLQVQAGEHDCHRVLQAARRHQRRS